MLEQSALYREIHAQPESLSYLLNEGREIIGELASRIEKQNINGVVIAARGSSDNAGRYAQYLLGAQNRLPVSLTTPSLFTIYARPPHFAKQTLVIGISQSGRSPDIVSVISEAREQGVLTAAFTNRTDSALADAAEIVVPLHAGEERSIAATKTYTGELLALAMLSAQLSKNTQMQELLYRVPGWIGETLHLNAETERVAERFRYMQHCVVIGRGYNYSTAFEIALKLKELTYIIAEPYSSADFLHGPLALIENGFPAFLVAPSGRMSSEMVEFSQQLAERDAEITTISDDENLLSMARSRLPLPREIPEWLSPIAAVVPGQLLSLYLAAARNFDPDHPRGLRKVTETR